MGSVNHEAGRLPSSAFLSTPFTAGSSTPLPVMRFRKADNMMMMMMVLLLVCLEKFGICGNRSTIYL